MKAEAKTPVWIVVDNIGGIIGVFSHHDVAQKLVKEGRRIEKYYIDKHVEGEE